MHKLLLVTAALLLAGCVTSANKIAQIELGMDRAQVVAVLGQPRSVSARDGGVELLRYDLSGREAPLLNPNDRRWAEGYTVKLTDGKVTAFGRDDEFRELRVTN
jgi:hypothetical protein